MSAAASEEWRAVVGYEGLYEVSDHGRVRSLPRRIVNSGLGPGKSYTYEGKTLKPLSMKVGYFSVVLSHRGVKVRKYVHRIVCEAFHGEPPAGKPYACHRDGTRTNNTPENLRWDSPKGNSKDSIRHGTSRNPRRFDTHCGSGHEYTPETTSKSSKGTRRCRLCEAATARSRTKRGGLPTDTDARHGTTNGYTNWGCRCHPCVLAGKAHNQLMKQQRRNNND